MSRPPRNAIQRYIDRFLADKLLEDVFNFTQWPALEDVIGEVYFGLANHFCPAEYRRVPSQDFHPSLPTVFRRAETQSVQYLAVNFRGLYQRNGRETIVAPFGALRRYQPKIALHYSLHEEYMQLLSRKTASINQLFLANTSLESLSVRFGDRQLSKVAMNNDHKQAHLEIGKDISVFWDKQMLSWQAQTRAFLQNRNDQTLGRLRQTLVTTRQEIVENVNHKSQDLLGTEFYRQWSRIPHRWKNVIRESSVNKTPSLNETVERFAQWIRSLCWLSFHCNSKHAGQFFYSVRLPLILEPHNNTDDQSESDEFEKFPHSSVSIVSKVRLPMGFQTAFYNFPKALRANNRFRRLCKHAVDVFTTFETARHQKDLTGEEGNLARFISPLGDQLNRLTVDFRKVDFLLRMARLLVGRRHEHHPLHFCFIFGFSSERIDSESKGPLKEMVSELRAQWERFERKVIVKSIAKKLNLRRNRSAPEVEAMLDGEVADKILALFADGMAKWITTTDLPLQPWDTALFLEEADTKPWPVPTSIVRISSIDGSQNDSVATELQLRQALKAVTKDSQSTVAVLVGDTGLVLFALGNSILVSTSTGTSYRSKFEKIRLWGSQVDAHKFIEFLSHLTAKSPFNNVGENTRALACKVIVDLCEALVTLGHGALIVLRASPKPIRDLPPLNPVWIVEPGKNAPHLVDGILFYAYMAALDGATEIYLPEGEGPISFSVRRSVLPEKKVWRYDNDGDAILSRDFLDVDALGLVGKGTRHHSALALSADNQDDIILTVSADGPVTIWQGGRRLTPEDDPEYQPRFKP